jgi:hypothetical protein
VPLKVAGEVDASHAVAIASISIESATARSVPIGCSFVNC